MEETRLTLESQSETSPHLDRRGGFRERHRTTARYRGGGFLFTRLVSDRLGTVVATMAEPVGLHPTVLTLSDLVIGVAGSVLVYTLAGSRDITEAGAAAALLWSLAYVVDCSDGQLARATRTTSAGGARVDLLTDAAVQASVLVAVSAVTVRYAHPPIVLVVLFAATWYVNFLLFLLEKSPPAEKGKPEGFGVLDLVKLPRDYGLLIAVFGLSIAFGRGILVYEVAVLTVYNSLILVASIAIAARRSLRPATDESYTGGGI